MTKIKPTQGKILISEPFLQDQYFKRSVVLLADHGDDGSFGIILNKPINIRLNEVINEFPDFDCQLYMGGPVKTDSLFFVHTLGSRIEGSMKIMEGLYWGGEIEIVKELMQLRQISPEDIRFFIGYSGWESNQLEDELKQNSWVVSGTRVEQVINNNPTSLWSDIIRTLGKEYEQWVNYPLDPSLN
jgi:putative transcriptional regulator